jgi:predicted kinase
MIKKLILTKGLPASGKSTWAKEQTIKDPTIIRVCRDDIRDMFGPYWVPKRENLVTELENQAILSALLSNFVTAVIVDATNLNPKTLKRFADMTLMLGPVSIEIKDFTHIDVETCVVRDAYRGETGGRSVGEKVIRDFHDKYLRTS